MRAAQRMTKYENFVKLKQKKKNKYIYIYAHMYTFEYLIFFRRLSKPHLWWVRVALWIMKTLLKYEAVCTCIFTRYKVYLLNILVNVVPQTNRCAHLRSVSYPFIGALLSSELNRGRRTSCFSLVNSKLKWIHSNKLSE